MKAFNLVTIIRIAFLLVFVVASTVSTLANDKEDKIYQGYVITIDGDTIHGTIEMLSPALNEIKVKFYNKEGKKTVYKAKELQGYAFLAPVRYNKKTKQEDTQWVHYTKCTMETPAVPFGTKEVLVQEEVGGTLSLYNYYIERPQTSATPLVHVIYLKDVNGKFIEINKKSYRKIVNKVFN